MTMFDRLTLSRRRWALVAGLALVVGAAPAFLRAFVNDDATYVLVAQKLNAGALLYRQAVDNKPPLIYATVAAVFRIFGPASLAGLKLLTLAVQLVCAGLVFSIGRRLFGSRVGAIAALFFSLAAASGLAEDFAAPNTEIYANLFILGAVAALSDDRPSRRALVAAGVLLGVASLYRLQSAAALLGAVLHLWLTPTSRRERAAATSLLALGFALPLGLCAAYFGARGTAGDLWLWAVRSNIGYVGVGEARVGRLALRRVALMSLAQLPLLLVATRVATRWRSVSEPPRTQLRFVLLLLLTALLAYRTGSRFYGHYFLQALPFLALLAAWGFANLPRERNRWMRLVPHLLVLQVVAFGVVNVVRLTARRDVNGLASTVAYVRGETSPADEVLLWSAPAELSLESGRRFATRFPFNNSLTGRIFGTDFVLPGTTRVATHPFENAEAWQRFEQDLIDTPPAIIVDGSAPDFQISRYPRLASYLDQYDPPRHLGELLVYRRRATMRH
jgi:hypothetical protein